MKKIIAVIYLLCLLDGCSSNDIMRNGKYVGHYKVGKPYKINKATYVPKEVDHYHQVGMASWYGDGFHGNKTANGERFNKHSLTAAHPTLPMPSIVRVTNLRNNKSVVVRVNDRGPFGPFFGRAKNRIIDLSEKAAEILGIKRMGVEKVSVQLLPKATAELHRSLKISNLKY